MNSKGGSGAGSILFTCLIIGALVAYWFYDASLFAKKTTLDLAHRSYMPVACSIAYDRSTDSHQAAQAYFWNGKVRVDLQIQGEQKISAHEIILPTGASYAWRDDSGYGKLGSDADATLTLGGLHNNNAWLCFPWLFMDFSKFTVPGHVTFE